MEHPTHLHLLSQKRPPRLHQLSHPRGLLQDSRTAPQGKALDELQYPLTYLVNSETEQAVLAISLTESSLGNIASMNSQSCKMFNFPSKEEMLELRVNDIMPSVYSILHDNILSSFLKNRFKNINQDLRFVFGKNKNGFIFPFLLQLRKLSWNLND